MVMSAISLLCLGLGCEHHGLDLPVTNTITFPRVTHENTLKTNSCQQGMQHVNHPYCTRVTQNCSVWLDPPTVKPGFRRCKTYAPAHCAGDRILLDFCIDTFEHKEEGSDLPMSNVSWTESQSICESEGKRLCTAEEWTLACEGPDLLAHPYGNTRDHSACYNDKVLSQMLSHSGELLDLRLPVDTHPRCVSPFGVRNMVGNVGELTTDFTHDAPFRSVGKGGWWNSGLRSRCRPVTEGHDEFFKMVQIGFRCCSQLNKLAE